MQNGQLDKYAILFLRISLGVVFIAQGLLKVVVFTLPGTAEFFEGAGFPGWLAYPVTYLEIGGGALLIAGNATRPLCLLFLPILLGVLWLHAGNGWGFSNPKGGWEFVPFLIVATVVQTRMGSGALTLEPVAMRYSKNALARH